MVGLIRAEFRKLFSTQVWFWLLFATLALVTLGVLGQMLSPRSILLSDTDFIRSTFATAQTAYIAVFVLGVLSVTTEFRHQTITPTLLATPSRWALVTAKMIFYAVVGAGYAVLAVLLEIAMAWPWLTADGYSFSLADYGIPRVLFGVFLVVMLSGIIGLGAGALIRNQIVAVVVGLLFLLILENIVQAIPVVKNAYAYLPAGASASILLSGTERATMNVHLLPPLAAVVVLLLWAFIPAILGASLTLNRDIT